MYNINAAVQKQEDIGRSIFTSTFPLMRWTENTDIYGRWDVSGSTRSTYAASLVAKKSVDMYAEIKVRNLKSTDYNTTYLEKKKYDAMIDLANQTSTGKAFYFVSFTDDASYLFYLKNIEVHKYQKSSWMKEKTYDQSSKYLEKLIYDLPLNLAVRKFTKR
jgi:hypothetical protein